MKIRKRMGLPKECAVHVAATNGAAKTSGPENTISLLMERLAGTVVQERSRAPTQRPLVKKAPQPPVMSSRALFSSRLQYEQDRFDVQMAKVPKDKFVSGLGNLIHKRGL